MSGFPGWFITCDSALKQLMRARVICENLIENCDHALIAWIAAGFSRRPAFSPIIPSWRTLPIDRGNAR